MQYTKVRNYTSKQLLDRMASLPSFKGFPIGYFVIYVRSNEDTYNEMDDKKYTFLLEKGMSEPKFVQVDPCTTNPGSTGLMNFQRYNKLGAAVLRADHIVYEGFRRGVSKGRPAYREDKVWGHYRDNNKDKKVDTTGIVHMKKIYAHIHGPKSRYSLVRWIYGQSLGCLVDSDIPKYNKWFKMLEGQEYLTACILNEF